MIISVNKSRKVLASLLVMVFATLQVWGQAGSGQVYGVVSDKQGPLPDAIITLYQGGIVKSQAKTDDDGKFSIKPVPSGDYELEARAFGIGTKTINFYMPVDGTSEQNFILGATEDQKEKEIVGVTVYSTKLLSEDAPPSTDIVSSKMVNQQASRNTSDFANLAGSTLSGKKGDGSQVSIAGGRNENTVYIIDGIIVRGSRNVNLPIGSIASVEVMSSGLPAKYGDATGGVITLTTKGISRETHGGLFLERSVEGYGHNQVSFNLSGPIARKWDSSINAKRPVAGYFLAADYINNKDGNPNYYKNITLNPEKMAFLEANPLTRSASGGQSFQKAAEFVTADDWEYVKYRPNARSQSGQIVTKLDLMPSIRTNITIGAQLNYSQYQAWNKAYSLLAPTGIPNYDNYTGRAYLRFTQRFANGEDSKLKNVYFLGQFSYQQDFLGQRNEKHKDDFFRYGYFGKFEEDLQPIYTYDMVDSLGQQVYQLEGYRSQGLTYERSEDNPTQANYTSYVTGKVDLNTIQEVQNYGGLRNGDNPGTAQFSQIFNIGYQYRFAADSRSDQTSFNFETGFTVSPGAGKTDHNIEAGFFYEQRNDRYWSLGAQNLWTLMRLSANKHLANLDYSNPIIHHNGKVYSYEDFKNGLVGISNYDTVTYNRLYVADEQSYFDKQLRAKLGLAVDGTDFIQIDALDPSTFSLDMFSADDLFNQGAAYVSYSGYDHLGNIKRGRTNFNDFFLEQDAEGNYTRPIDAFRPVYMAGYLMDKFRYKDINFNLGLRLDRYDANTKVMRDPYSLYGVRTLGDLAGVTYSTYNDVGVPSNIGSDYVVYVGDNQSENPTIAGYRNGDEWYDPFGRRVDDPKTLQNEYSGGSNNLQPFLQNNEDDIKKATEEMLNRSFADYKPQLTVSPRLQFSFPINDNSLVYAHYDVVVQRPKGTNTTGIGNINFFNPYDYYYFEQNQDRWVANPNLKPERKIEYEVGFQQVISEKARAVLTLSTYYMERKDQIQVRPYFYAYPKTYNTFGNRDFSTSKGLRVKFNTNIGSASSLLVNYQYAITEGTGSSTTSQISLIQSGQGSLRPTAFYLNNDVRHNFKLNFYSELRLKNTETTLRKIMNGFNANIMANLLSGRPYTRVAIPVPYGGNQNGNPIVGTLNGSRLPWNFNIDLRVSKDIIVSPGRPAAEGMSAKGPKTINIFSYIQNILNTRNVLGVYQYTGNPDSDGYLDSGFGQQALSQIAEAQRQSYIDMYNFLLYNNPNYFNTPRRIIVGLSYNF